MKYRDHLNLAFVSFNIMIYITMVKNIFNPYFLNSLMFFGFLIGAVCPDFDINFYDAGHRTRSPFHNFANAIGFTLAVFILSRVSWIFMTTSGSSDMKSLVQVLKIYEVFTFLVFLGFGWIVHLIGDIIQGGIKCSGFKKKIGISKWDWDSYYGERGCFDFTLPGNLISFLLFVFCIMMISKNEAFYSINSIPLILWILFLISGSFRNLVSKIYVTVILFGLIYLIAKCIVS